MKRHPWSFDAREMAKVEKSRQKRRDEAAAFAELCKRSNHGI